MLEIHGTGHTLNKFHNEKPMIAIEGSKASSSSTIARLNACYCSSFGYLYVLAEAATSAQQNTRDL
jgi:hypothetical protein